MKVGSHVKVGPHKPNGEDHPHAGKTGVVTEFQGMYLHTAGRPPAALVRVDPGIEPQGVIVVSVVCLEEI